MPLPDKPWDQLTDEEKEQWTKAAEENGPRLIGGIIVSGEDFNRTVRAQWRRKEGRQTY